MHYRSVGHGYHAIPISHPTSSNAPRHAGPSRAGPGRDELALALASREARHDKSSRRVQAEGRAGDSLTGLVKIRKLPSAHLQSITGFSRSGCTSSSRIICLSPAREGFSALARSYASIRATSNSGGGTRYASRENKTTPSGGRGGGRMRIGWVQVGRLIS